MLKKNDKMEVPIYVLVLQAGAWPLSAPSGSTSDSSTSANNQQDSNGDYVPPPVLQSSLRLFEEYYATKKHSGRKLTWLYNNSTAEVQLNYLEKNCIGWFYKYFQ